MDAGPRDGEAICGYPEIGEKIEVFGVAVVVVAGDVTGVAIENATTVMTERIPNGWRTAVFGHRSFDLVGRSGCSPHETFWEAAR